MRLLLGAALGALIATGVLWEIASPNSNPRIDAANAPNGQSDRSGSFADLERQFVDEAVLVQLTPPEDVKIEALAKIRAERLAREMVTLPDGVPDFPFEIALFAPEDDHHWPELKDPDIQAMLDDHKENWVIVNYWATWCAPCIHELPDMNNASSPFADLGVSLIALNADPMGKDTPESIKGFLSEKGIDRLMNATVSGDDIHNAMAAGSMQMPGSFSYPHNIVFAPGGVPYAYFEGLPIPADNSPIWASEEMLSFFEALVASKAT